MDCIEFEGSVEELSLLTHNAKLEKLTSVLSKNKQKADLFLPDETFYPETVSAEDPERMADIMFRWLGVKHRSLTFRIDPDQQKILNYKHTKNTSRVTLGLICLEDSFVCAAAIAHAIVHHMLIARSKISLGSAEENEGLTDLGTIYAGFGILILNSMSSSPVLGSMAKKNYGGEFMDYCADNRIVEGVWEPFVLPTVAHEFLSQVKSTGRFKPFIMRKIEKSKASKRKLILAFCLATVISGLAVTAYLTRPQYISVEMQEKRDEIAILKTEIDQCQQTVKRKQETWDQSDIFMQRQIDADKTRCMSLTNRYNYSVNEYNAKL